MNASILVLVLLALDAAGYVYGRRKALAGAGGDFRELHSLPGYYGTYVALWCILPALFVVALWLALQAGVLESLVLAGMPAGVAALSPGERTLMMSDVRNLGAGVRSAR